MLETKDRARRMDAETREKTAAAKEVFDTVLVSQNENKELRKEIQFLKGVGTQFYDKKTVKDLADQAA
jgi:hypothetical protein